MKRRFGRRSGQTMVEYIIIVVLIAITLIVLFSKFGQATGKKIAGATQALDSDIGESAKGAYGNIDDNRIKSLDEDGNGLGGNGR